MSDDVEQQSTQVEGSRGISSPAFQGLLWTQALTATNDNVFRWFVIGIGKTQFMPESYPLLLAAGSAFFLVPYIVFASVAGWLGDRFSKRRVILGCKIAEIFIMSLGVFAVSLLGEPDPSAGPSLGFYVMLLAVFLMGTQSALFAPSKVGTIPELLDERQISAGNGIFALTTLSATIVGTGVGGWVADSTIRAWRAGDNTTLLPGLVMIGIAVVGTGLALLVRSLPAANPEAKFPKTLIGETWRDIRALSRTGPLFWVALGVAYFWSIAGLAQLNIDVFAEQSGGLVESHRTPLLIAVTLGIGIGSLFAGYVSAGHIRLGLVPYGAVGIAVFCLLLAFAPSDFITDPMLTPKMVFACLLLGGLGFCAGVFDVPLASYLQHYSPIAQRGSLLAATNCLAFAGILVLSGVFTLLQWPVGQGSLENLPASITRAGLGQQEQRLFDDAVEAHASADPPKSLKEFVAEAPAAIRPALLSQLVASDVEKRRQSGESASLNDYTVDFPDDARQIKKVIRQTGSLPLLTSRQVFMFMSLMCLPVILYAFKNHQRLQQGVD